MNVTMSVTPNSPSCTPRHNPFDGLKDDVDFLPVIDRLDYAPLEENQGKVDTAKGNVTSTETVGLLSEGLLAHFLPPLEQAKKNLDDLAEKQQIILETFQTENQRYNKAEAIRELASKTDQIKIYHEKLLSVRKTMASLHERSTRLKRRALRLQSERQKEELAKETAKELEREKERKLIARTDFGTSSN